MKFRGGKIKLYIREDLVPEGFKGKYKPRVYLHGKRPYVGTRMKVTVIEKGKPVKKNKIVSYARYIYGLDRIPEDHVIWHIDGDSLNNAIENLECITKEESYIRMREVSLHSRLRL